MSELRKVLSISASHKNLIEQLKEMDALGFKLASTSDIFLLAMSMGIDDPKELKKRDTYVRTEYITKARDKALFECVPLGRVTDDKQLDEYSDLESCLDECERCAESGFQKLQELINEADGDKELFEKDLWARLDYIYNCLV